MDTTVISIVTAISVVLFSILYYARKYGNAPPGPIGVPYLGMYPFLHHDTYHLQLTEYAKKYGDVFSFTYTGKLFLNLGSIKAIREFQITQSENFYGRFTDFNVLSYILGPGVTMLNGEAWKVMKKFFFAGFKTFGLLGERDQVISSLLDELKSKKDSPLDLVKVLTPKCMKTMRKTMFGEHGISDEEVETFLEWHTEALDNLTGVNIMLIGPFGRFLYFVQPSNRRALNLHVSIRKLFLKVVKRIEASFDGENPTCIVENFYKERNDKKKKNDPTWEHYTDLALVCTLVQFIGDGTLGAATFVCGFINALIDHPEEQDKIYEELMEAVGPNRQPTQEDRNKLPYTTAFMSESVRISNFFPMFPSLECSKETTIQGYRIPKGSITLLNFWAAHHDPKVYKDPHTFNPSRFLSTPEKPREELPVQFGVGKRYCNGEGYVMLEAFTYLTTIVRNYRILPAGDRKKISEQFLQYSKLDVYLHPRDE